MPVPNQIERTVDLSHPVEKVWSALTTAEGLAGWFGQKAQIDLRPGGEAQLYWEGHGGSTLWIQVVEPPRRFAYTWGIEGVPDSDPRRTYVEFTLTPNETGTRLTVVESGFAQLPDELGTSAHDGNIQGWQSEIDELVTYLDAAA